MTEVIFRQPDLGSLLSSAEEEQDLRAGTAAPAGKPPGAGRARDERQKAANRNGLSRKARRETAGARAIQRLISLHEEEFGCLLEEEYPAGGTEDQVRVRADRLVRAGLSVPVAEAFARDVWPSGEIAPGVMLAVGDESEDSAPGGLVRCLRQPGASGPAVVPGGGVAGGIPGVPAVPGPDEGIRAAQRRAWENKTAKGFNTVSVPLEFCLLYGEVAEAFDAWRKDPEGVGGELADIFIYLAGLAQMTGTDLASETARKLAVVEARTYVPLPNGTLVKSDGVPAGTVPPDGDPATGWDWLDGRASRPRTVCLCGSTRFYEEFRRANLRLTLAGEIVHSIGCDTGSDGDLAAAGEFGLDPAAVKARLDELHKRKIDQSDYVLVLNPGGYIGESTRGEIEYARAAGKPVRYLQEPGGAA